MTRKIKRVEAVAPFFLIWFFLKEHSVWCVGNDYPWANFVLQLAESIEKFIGWHFIRLAANEKLLFLCIRYWRACALDVIRFEANLRFHGVSTKSITLFREFMDCFSRRYS